MTGAEFWQHIEAADTPRPAVDGTSAYPAAFDDGRRLVLPLRALPDGEHAVASLIVNQASFAVVDALALDLAGKLRPCAPDVVVGLPTLGLTLAAAVARHLGHERYVPLGTSRKFWYRDELSVDVRSITSPDVTKRLYIDPRMLPLLHERRVVLVDDVISSGVSMAAGLALLARCGCMPVAVAAAMLQTERWRERLAQVSPSAIVTVLRTPLFERGADGAWTAAFSDPD